jgi:hypothetical protein
LLILKTSNTLNLFIEKPGAIQIKKIEILKTPIRIF